MATQRQHDRALAKVREICLGFPEVTERPSHGAPSFFIRGKKTICMFHDDHHGDGRLAVWCPAFPGVQEELVERSVPLETGLLFEGFRDTATAD